MRPSLILLLSLLTFASFLPAAQAQEEIPTSDCGPEDVTMTYTLRHADGSTTVVTSLQGNVSEGDLIYTSLFATSDCQGVEGSIITYTRNPAENSASSYDLTQGDFGAEGFLTLGPVLVPDCVFAVNVFVGEGWTLRRIDFDEGGDGACPEMASWQCRPLTASAESDGKITLRWGSVFGATTYEVMRKDSELTPFVTIATLGPDATSYVDTNTTVGATYTYVVKPMANGHEAKWCAPVTITAVPFFSGPVMLGLVTVGALGAFVWMRRR